MMGAARWRLPCRAAAAAIVMLTPQTVWGQGSTYARMAVSMTQTYDGNLFAAPASRHPQGDLFSRVGPVLEAGYASLPLEIVARYEVAAERYLRRVELNKNLARQEAAVAVGYLPMRRLSLDVDASYVRTQTPGEFNLDSQLAVARAPADRAVIGSTATFEWSPVTQVAFGHAFARDALAGGVASAAHHARVRIARRTGLRSTYRVEYEFRHTGFSEGAPDASYVITGGWLRGITERTSLELAAGPRVGEGTVRPELSALLRRRLWAGEISVSYLRTELTAIGERGTIDVHRVAATGTHRPVRHLTLRGTPAFTRSTRGDTHAPVYTLDLEAVIDATRRVSLLATGRFGRQEGTLGGTREAIPYRSLALKLVVKPAPASARAVARLAS